MIISLKGFVIISICEGLIYILSENGDVIKNNELTASHLSYNRFSLRGIEILAFTVCIYLILEDEMGFRFFLKCNCLNLATHYFLVFTRFCNILIVVSFHFILVTWVIFYSFFMIYTNSRFYKKDTIYD